MPVPSEAQLANPNSSANGLTQQQITERITALLAMLTSGTAPDGTPLSLAAQTTPGSLIVVGHSYTAGTTLLDSGVSNVFQESVVSRLQGLLHITDDNVLHLGQAGSALSLTSVLATTDQLGGWPGVLQFIVPPNSPNAKATSDPFYAYNAATSPGTCMIVHGVNDYSNDYNTAITNVASVQATYSQTAWKNALRGVLSRLRASVIYGPSITPGTGNTAQWDGSLAFSGFASVVPNVSLNTGPAFRQSTTNGNTVTFTIPAEVAGQTVCMCFIGQQNAMTYLTAAVTTTGQTAWTVNNTGAAAAASFPATNFTGIIGNEQVLIGTGGNTVNWVITTRGFNGTTASTYGIGTPIQIAPQHSVVFSGTAANATGTLILGGQGQLGANVCVVKRFATTAADAGKTIIATVQNLSAGDTRAAVNFDSVWVEAKNPPPIVLTNLHHHPYAGSPANTQLTGQIPGFNAATSSVVAEFDNKVQIADVYTPFFNASGTITNAPGAGGVTINWTCNSSTYTPVVGSVFSFGTGVVASGVAEHVQVTAVTGTAPNFVLTVTRGYDGSTPFAWPQGSVLSPMDWMSRFDDLHLNSAGHALYAATLYNAFLAMPAPTSVQEQGLRSAAFSEYSQRRASGPFDNRWYPTPTLGAATGVPTINTQYWSRIFIPKKSVLVGMGLQVAATTTSLTARFGIYTNGISRDMPQRMLQDFGSHVTTGAAPYVAGGTGASIPLTGLYQILNPGTYWLSTAVTVNTGGGTLVSVNAISQTEQLSLNAIPASATFAPANCYTQTGISGAFADAPVKLGGGSAFNPVSDPTCPLMWYLLRTVMYV